MLDDGMAAPSHRTWRELVLGGTEPKSSWGAAPQEPPSSRASPSCPRAPPVCGPLVGLGGVAQSKPESLPSRS